MYENAKYIFNKEIILIFRLFISPKRRLLGARYLRNVPMSFIIPCAFEKKRMKIFLEKSKGFHTNSFLYFAIMSIYV